MIRFRIYFDDRAWMWNMEMLSVKERIEEDGIKFSGLSNEVPQTGDGDTEKEAGFGGEEIISKSQHPSVC